MTQIISLHSGPGTGKSTSAAQLFAELKQRHCSVELVREYVKKWAWEGRKISGFDDPATGNPRTAPDYTVKRFNC